MARNHSLDRLWHRRPPRNRYDRQSCCSGVTSSHGADRNAVASASFFCSLDPALHWCVCDLRLRGGRAMKTFAMRVAILTTVLSLNSFGHEAVAGFRHLRMFQSGCAGPGCSGPSFGCSARTGCYVPTMTSCCGSGGSGPAYVTPPMMTCAGAGSVHAMPAYPEPLYNDSTDFQPAWHQAGTVGAAPMAGFDPSYHAAPVYGSTGPAMPLAGGYPLGVPGFGGTRSLPAYYAPVSAPYAPILPGPAADLVW